MSTFSFLGSQQVHDTVLVSMIITSLLNAIRRFKDPETKGQVFWNFLYDWATGFWSMKTGQHSSAQSENPTQPETTPAPTK